MSELPSRLSLASRAAGTLAELEWGTSKRVQLAAARRIANGIAGLYEPVIGELREEVTHLHAQLDNLGTNERDWRTFVRNWHDRAGHGGWAVCDHEICRAVIDG